MEDSVGLVETRHVTLFDPQRPLRLDSGATLAPLRVAYETYGTLNADGSNAILICHALSGNAHAAGRHRPDDRRPGWWDGFIGPGKPFDTNRFFVISSNNLGGCDGTTGPTSADPRTGQPYGLSFPLFTIGDIVRVQQALVAHLGISRLLAVAGGSMGGMQALQWALDYPGQVGSAVVIAATAQLSAQNIAFNEVARQAIRRDPHFNEGDYHGHRQRPVNGLAIARMMAHITYLSEQGLSEKFGRRLQDRDSVSFAFEKDFAIESYLNHQGASFVDRFDANTYLYITKAMDYFDPFPDTATAARRLSGVRSRWLVLSFDSDWRFTTARSRELVQILNRHGQEVTFEEFSSPHGHDTFLLDVPAYKATLRTFLARLHKEQCGG
ncbi:MAG: homoserine O-acetyltransferase [Magnetococcus sp. WYHC-3]